MFDSPFYGMAEMFGAFFLAMWIPYILVFVFLPVLIYLVARWRQHKAGVADSHLGLKCGLGLFRVLAVQMALAGTWMFLFSLIAEGDNETMTRTAFGLLLPAGIVFGVQAAVLARTNHAFMPMPVRMFRGMEMVQTGMAAIMALVIAFMVTVQKDPPDEVLKAVWSMTAVYGTGFGLMLNSLLGDAIGPIGSAAPVSTNAAGSAAAAAAAADDQAEAS